MKISQRLQGVRRLFLDTAPVVYYVEENTRYLPAVDVVFDMVDNGLIVAVTSPVTLAECLIIPYRKGQQALGQAFYERITSGNNTEFVSIDKNTAQDSAILRARYNLSLLDCFQISLALSAGCDVFLTNDAELKRVTELDVVVLDDMEVG